MATLTGSIGVSGAMGPILAIVEESRIRSVRGSDLGGAILVGGRTVPRPLAGPPRGGYCPPVPRVPFHPVFVVLVCLAQLTMAHLSPAGVLICRDAEGTSHFEWAVNGCCPGDADEGIGAPATADSPHDADQSACEDGGCSDRLIAHEKSRGGRPRALACAVGAAPQPPAFGACRADLTPPIRPSVRFTEQSPGTGGPPAHLAASLRSTVLLV